MILSAANMLTRVACFYAIAKIGARAARGMRRHVPACAHRPRARCAITCAFPAALRLGRLLSCRFCPLIYASLRVTRAMLLRVLSLRHFSCYAIFSFYFHFRCLPYVVYSAHQTCRPPTPASRSLLLHFLSSLVFTRFARFLHADDGARFFVERMRARARASFAASAAFCAARSRAAPRLRAPLPHIRSLRLGFLHHARQRPPVADEASYDFF